MKKDGILIQVLKHFKRNSTKNWSREDYPGYTFSIASARFTGRADVNIGVNDDERQIVILVSSTTKEEVCQISWGGDGVKTKLLDNSGLAFDLIVAIEEYLEFKLVKEGLIEASKIVKTESDIVNRVFSSTFCFYSHDQKKFWECEGYFLTYLNYTGKEILLGKKQNELTLFYRKPTVKLSSFTIVNGKVEVELYPGHKLVSGNICGIKRCLEDTYHGIKSRELFKSSKTEEHIPPNPEMK